MFLRWGSFNRFVDRVAGANSEDSLIASQEPTEDSGGVELDCLIGVLDVGWKRVDSTDESFDQTLNKSELLGHDQI